TNAKGKKFKLDISLLSITDENRKSYNYTTLYVNNGVQYKIGSKYTTLSGIHTYIISYEVKGALTYFKDHDELYWNATGNEWPVPIQESITMLTFPTEVPYDSVKTVCYTGAAGSSAKNCITDKTLVTLTSPLNSYEGITFAASFPPGIVAKLEPKPYVSFWDTALGQVLIVLIAIVAICAAIFWYIIYPIWLPVKWFLHGRDPNVGNSATAWFDPPQTKTKRPLTPAETGTLVDEKADIRDVMATIIDLAYRGYLKIEERKKDDFYIIRDRRNKKNETLQLFEIQILQDFFEDDPFELRIKGAELYKTVKEVQDLLYESVVREQFFPKNPQSIRNFYLVVISLAVFTLNPQLVLVSLLFGLNMARKTLDGAKAAKVAEALKNFLKSQDRQLNYQGEKQLLFEKLLPYAVAFGVEKNWAERFKDFKLTNPEWYSSYDNHSFTAMYFASRLGSSFNSFSGSATPPSSSGFSSGSSGGFSGGGGGGGGGGSW
ncbi:MAG: DUF2207 domain-containing protein, partial [Patescibacteria group bacterium]